VHLAQAKWFSGLLLSVAVACGPRATTTEPVRTAEAERPAQTTSAERPAEEASAGQPSSSDVSSGLDQVEPAAAEPSAAAAPVSKLSACCRALRDMAARAPDPQRNLVRRVAEHCERLATAGDVTAAQRELLGELVSIDPPAACHSEAP
jgi:hypothetical protein